VIRERGLHVENFDAMSASVEIDMTGVETTARTVAPRSAEAGKEGTAAETAAGTAAETAAERGRGRGRRRGRGITTGVRLGAGEIVASMIATVGTAIGDVSAVTAQIDAIEIASVIGLPETVETPEVKGRLGHRRSQGEELVQEVALLTQTGGAATARLHPPLLCRRRALRRFVTRICVRKSRS
jgi:hypothetical protein